MRISTTQGNEMKIKQFGFYFLLGIILVIAFKLYTIINVFFPAIATACVLTYLFNPIYEYFKKITKTKFLSAFAVIIIIFALILVPVTFIFSAVQKQIQLIFTENTIENMRNALQNFENLIFTKFNIQISDYITDLVPRLFSTVQEAITGFGPKMIYSITGFILSVFITIFLMYYLFINSKYVIDTFKDYFPLSYDNSRILLLEMGKDIKSLILGQLLIAVIQGSLGAIGFFICGIQGAVLWGLVMAIMSFIPVLGAGIVWFPATIILLAKGEYFNGIGLILWGFLIVSTSDNIIRPKLASTLGKIHPVTVLLGVFIGIKEWGLIGIVIGPIIISMLIILIKMFREEYLIE